MAEGKDNVAPLTGTKRLADAVRAAKIAAAHRSDVVVDIREADRARLEILAEALQPVIDDIPAGDEFFDLALSGGPQPRFWVDGTAHVSMARDRRTYRFVRETRIGRLTLAESTDMRTVADRVTTYIAERIVEREKAFAEPDNATIDRRTPRDDPGDGEPIRPAAPAASQPSFAFALSWLLIGMAIGAGILFAIATLRGLQIR
ncbi:hypothetical protein [Aureimonas leprariae]|uniref:Uncharacterized protein n=1 Tax=Plantimonas leprariae TaxID=2615207 RepID=A0A7V7PPC1_9HYPH|nr:hypothetical protein [Aureimonas leprariae]KAB0679838.1 hypothetical protein F6X38_11465 [Aureimonas leprariae]